MTYLERKFADTFRGAAHEELINGEAQFMADMADILTPETIKEGVSIDFGPERERFEQVLALLGVEKSISDGKLEVWEPLVSYGGGNASFVAFDRVQNAIKEHGVLTTLEYMQAEAWGTEKTFNLYPYITTKGSHTATSEISFGGTQPRPGVDGEKSLSFDAPIITVNNWVKYSPTAIDEYGESDDIATFINNNPDEGGRAPRLFQKLLERRITEGSQLSLPERAYRLSISTTPLIFSGVLTPKVGGRIAHWYNLTNDRIVPYVEPEMGDEDDPQL